MKCQLLHIKIKPSAIPTDSSTKQIRDALKRIAELDPQNITVERSGGGIVLRGTVRTWGEKEKAEEVAWRAPGVSQVDNRLRISP